MKMDKLWLDHDVWLLIFLVLIELLLKIWDLISMSFCGLANVHHHTITHTNCRLLNF